MIVMPANVTRPLVREWAEKYPDSLGNLFSPRETRSPLPGVPFALDNGAFIAWRNGTPWSADDFRALVARYAPLAPSWILVPDVVTDRAATLDAWDRWADELRATGCPLAFALQDGMTPDDVPRDADVVFLGGSTYYKRATLNLWAQHFPRVHVGRINTEKWLWRCHAAGVESCDGTGWFRGRRAQLEGLVSFLERQAAGHRAAPHANYELAVHA